METFFLMLLSVIAIAVGASTVYFFGYAVRVTKGDGRVVLGAGFLVLVGFNFLSLGMMGIGTLSGLENLLDGYSAWLNVIVFSLVWLSIVTFFGWAGYNRKKVSDLLRRT